MRTSYLLSATATAMLVGASAATATTYDITYVAVDPPSLGNSVVLTGSLPGGAILPTPENSGLILLTTPGGQTLTVFCVDLFHDINIGGYPLPGLPYGTGSVTTDSSGAAPGVGNTLAAGTADQIQTLADLGGDWYRKGVLTGDEATALQDAIWTIEYGNNGGGHITVNADSGGAIDMLAAQYVSYADAHPTNNSIGLYPTMYGQGFENGNGQGFVYGVPELSSWAMMGLGFAGLGFAGFRKARAKPAFA